MKISQDDVDAWKANPVTEAFFRRIDVITGELHIAWEAALVQPIGLTELQMLRIEIKSKLDLIDELAEVTAEDINDSDEDQKA